MDCSHILSLIISAAEYYDVRMFRDRREAGRLLAKKLEEHEVKNAIVLALPRGGVVLGAEVARELELPLDIIVVRKIGHPASSEYAIGVVDEKGNRIMNKREEKEVDLAWLRTETERQQAEAQRRLTVYRGGRPPLAIAGRTAVLVDDGIATGFSMRLAVRSVKAQKAAKIIVAVPVSSTEAVQMLTAEGADDVVLLIPPQDFLGAVGAHYVSFPQTSDEEVVTLLKGNL